MPSNAPEGATPPPGRFVRARVPANWSPVSPGEPGGVLDRIEPAILDLVSYNMELRPDGTEDPLTAAYVEGVHASLDAVRAVLAEVSPEPGGLLDRDQALQVLYDYQDGTKDTREAIDALEAAVRPAAIDRDALVRILSEVADGLGIAYPTGEVADRILALVRPVAGVTLTPEEAALAAEALHIGQESLDDYADQFSDVDARVDEGKTRTAAAGMRALAARLEAGAVS